MIAVTGMHRSGTSCVTGLLEKCGFNLGTSHSLFKEPRFDNPKGHFENKGAMLVNEIVFKIAGGSWDKLPSEESIIDAGERNCSYFYEFAETFNGDIFKDPRISVTFALWRKFCTPLKTVVFCLRNPVAVAVSLNTRDGISIEDGLMLWYEYNIRFLQHSKGFPVVVVDYDNFENNLEFEISNLLLALGSSMSILEIRNRIKGFYSKDLNHDPSEKRHLNMMPEEILTLYNSLKMQTFSEKN